jgi:hypothetical protein
VLSDFKQPAPSVAASNSLHHRCDWTYIASVSNKPERQFHVGQKIRINLHAGRIEDATVKAIVERTDGLRLQVDFGHEQTALIHAWQVVED